MPIKETHTKPVADDKRPKVGHLAVLKSLAPASWMAIEPGAYMGAGDGNGQYMPLLLQRVKMQKSGMRLELTFQCCGNKDCTRTLKLEGLWTGRHVDRTGSAAEDAAKMTGVSK